MATQNKVIKWLVNVIKNLWNISLASYVEITKSTAIELDLKTDFPEKRKVKKKKRMISALAVGECNSIHFKQKTQREFNNLMCLIIILMEKGI